MAPRKSVTKDAQRTKGAKTKSVKTKSAKTKSAKTKSAKTKSAKTKSAKTKSAKTKSPKSSNRELALSAKRVRELKLMLEELESRVDFAARVASDPIRFPHRFTDPLDQELVSLLAALLAYGRVSAIGDAIERALEPLGDRPAQLALSDALARRAGETPPLRFEGFIYRFTRGPDLDKLWAGLGELIARHGSIGAAMHAHNDPNAETLIPTYQGFYDELIEASSPLTGGRGFDHLFSNPRRGSALKRVNMWLRWLVRGPDEVDLGLWSDLNPARLLLPLDVHTFRLCGALGLTARRSANLKTALEVSAQLKRLSPEDPIRYDFALAHLGISGACKGYRVPEICAQCALNPQCALKSR